MRILPAETFQLPDPLKLSPVKVPSSLKVRVYLCSDEAKLNTQVPSRLLTSRVLASGLPSKKRGAGLGVAERTVGAVVETGAGMAGDPAASGIVLADSSSATSVAAASRSGFTCKAPSISPF